jgi:hypothetical protein
MRINWGQIFAHAFARRIAFVVVAALLAWVGIGKAHAQAPYNPPDYQTEAQALTACKAALTASENWAAANGRVIRKYAGSDEWCHIRHAARVGSYTEKQMNGYYKCNVTFFWAEYGEEVRADCSTYGGGFPGPNTYWADDTVQCPTGQALDPASGTCQTACPAGEWADPKNSGQCLNAQKCNAKNDARPELLGLRVVNGSGGACVEGCAYGPAGGVDKVSSAIGPTVIMSDSFKVLGQACAAGAPPPAPEKPKQVCTQAGTFTYCQKPDGKQCYSATTGKQICWTPGETGEKNDGPVKQVRKAGETEIPPNLQMPNGDSLTKTGTSSTVTTTTNVTNNTTTTTNYTTTNGTNANGGKAQGTGNDGEKGDGSEDGPTASGGGDCNSKPIVNGDAALDMVATQSWATRCAVEAGSAAKVTGDVGDCASAFSVEGTSPVAHQLRAMRKQLCVQPDWTKKGEGDPSSEVDNGNAADGPGLWGLDLGTDVLDTGGFMGGGTCPQLPSFSFGEFTTIDFNEMPWFCNLVAIMRAVLLLVGAFIALRLLMGDV